MCRVFFRRMLFFHSTSVMSTLQAVICIELTWIWRREWNLFWMILRPNSITEIACREIYEGWGISVVCGEVSLCKVPGIKHYILCLLRVISVFISTWDYRLLQISPRIWIQWNMLKSHVFQCIQSHACCTFVLIDFCGHRLDIERIDNIYRTVSLVISANYLLLFFVRLRLRWVATPPKSTRTIKSSLHVDKRTRTAS